MATETARAPERTTTTDPMPVNGIDHLELYVGNAAQAKYFYERALGFRETAYRGLVTGSRESSPPDTSDEAGR